jgi:aryl-alcohol dehydrogenase-like predicted oxidoreductase
MYGAGLSEIRLGKYLAQHDRNDYVLSTKVGRLILDETDTEGRDSEMFKFGLVNRVVVAVLSACARSHLSVRILRGTFSSDMARNGANATKIRNFLDRLDHRCRTDGC